MLCWNYIVWYAMWTDLKSRSRMLHPRALLEVNPESSDMTGFNEI